MSARAAEGRARFDYTRGSVAGGLARLALPQSIELIAWNFENVSELFWVGRLGSEKLAALSIAYIMLWLPRSFGLGFLIAGNALVAQKIGAGDEEGASLLAGQTAFVSIVFSLAVSVPGVWFAADIMRLVTSDPEIVRGGADYLLVGFAVFIIPTGCFMLGLLFRGAGDAMLSSLGDGRLFGGRRDPHAHTHIGGGSGSRPGNFRCRAQRRVGPLGRAFGPALLYVHGTLPGSKSASGICAPASPFCSRSFVCPGPFPSNNLSSGERTLFWLESFLPSVPPPWRRGELGSG